MKRYLVVSVIAILSLMASAAPAQEIVLRHALDGAPLDALSTLVLRFNDGQKGRAKVVLQDVSAVEDRRQLPHLALLEPEDGMRFFDTRPRFKPLHAVMRESGERFDETRFFPQMADAVDDLTGRIQGLPMALAVPVLFYNKDAFLKAGLDPEVPPKTWWEVQRIAGRLLDAGFDCPLTTSRFAWVHLENISSQHGEPMLARSGKTDMVALNGMVHVKHVALLASWHKSLYFHYFGPGREGDARFLAGKCAMLTGESSLHADLPRMPRFPVGVAALPYYDDVYGARPADVLPDGAALWALPGKKKAEYRVAARFVGFLLRSEAQREWVRATGFLPMTKAALDALKEAAGVAVTPMVLAAAEKRLSAPRQKMARTKLGFGRNKVREILGEEIEFVWNNTKPAKEALDTAMSRANDILVAPAPVAEWQ
ncbi:MAG: extracellular solute-binding protein [Candidatus Nitricoxidivorans perseverans]|uniref:sn-glycerol-3-phosphate-binding periplasmic protein UgpB n=1 Tax=Candidatus Nitricoxidivorans perseverans TaxID=2975601 RepID=A0AA49FMK6_9PROT|nr:MAG: extracellular solute-binding protein [Candidatus Nitricoxidivorans perseverans]